jgi:phospholipid/cholesterol/gamma-HCH transport system ATP-binding protein
MSDPATARAAGRPPDFGDPVVEVAGLVAGYDDQPVLEDVSFTVREGETLVVLGPSGCGKSTLLRCLIGLLQPQAGSVRVLGHDLVHAAPAELDEVRRRMGVAFQSSALLGSLTVGDNVSLPLVEHTRLDPATIRIMTRLKLEQVGLGGSEDVLPGQLSGGMRKRAGIARAIAMDPKVLFLDEPSAGLDPITAAGLDGLLLKLRSALGLTMVVVTHELASAFAVAHTMLMLDRGRVIALGPKDDVRALSDDRVRRFFDRRPDSEEEDGRRLIEHLTR